MLKKLNKIKVFVLILCLFFVAGLSNALALSVDIKNLYYTDSSFTVANYDFTSGSWAGDWIVIPPPTFVPNDGHSYLYGLYPGTVGYTLSWAAPGPANLSVSASGSSDGAAIFYINPLPDNSTAQTAWTYSIRLHNFTGFGDSGKTNIIAAGMGSDAAENQPQIAASWLPNGHLQLAAQVGDRSMPLWQSSTPIDLGVLTPASTTLELKLVNTGSAINFYYNLNSAGEILIDTFESGDGYVADSFKGFPIVFPFVNLQMEDAFNAQSSHQQSDGKYYANAYVDDPMQATYSGVTVSKDATCGNALINVALTYSNGQWWLSPWVELSGAPPVCYPTFTFTATKNAGGTDIITRTVTGYVEAFATNLAPTGNTGAPVTFSWTGIAGADGYYVHVYNQGHMFMWSTNVDAPATSVIYNGPPLTSGQTYYYSVNANIETNGSWNHSQSNESSFTYVPTDITVKGTVRDWNGAVISGTPVTAGVYLSGSSTPLVTTTADPSTGDFMLAGVPVSTSFRLKFTATGYIPLFSAWSSRDVAGEFWYTCAQYGCNPMQLPTAADLNATGTGATPDADKAVIFGRVVDNTYRYSSNIAGAVVTATSDAGSKEVLYLSPFNEWGTTGTYQNGKFFVLNVTANENVTVTASKSGWDFSGTGGSRSFYTNAYTAHNGRVRGVSSSYAISIGGTVKATDGSTPIGSVMVALQGDNDKYIISAPNGTFMLGGLAKDTFFHLMLTKGGYAPSHVGPITRQSSLSNIDFIMWTTGELSTISPSGGMIAGSVRDSGFNPLSGATLTVTSKSGTTYTVNYVGGGGSTDASGKFYIPNVTAGDVLKIEVAKSGYTFESAYMNCFASTDVTQKIFVATEAAGSLLYADFASNGVWQYNGSTWTQLTPGNPEAMAAAGSLLYADFASNGVWQYNGSAWTQLTPGNPEAMAAAGSLLYADFASNGVWQYNGGTWTQLTPGNPEAMAAAGSLLYADFASNGVWQYNGSAWTQLTPGNPEAMAAAGSLLYADFASNGVWQYNGGTWTQLTPGNPEAMAAAGSLLYADFASNGVWQYNGSAWTQLTPGNPEAMAAAGSLLYADFASNGVWQYNGSAWTQLTPGNPDSIVAPQ